MISIPSVTAKSLPQPILRGQKLPRIEPKPSVMKEESFKITAHQGSIPAKALDFDSTSPTAQGDFGRRIKNALATSPSQFYGDDFATIVLKGRTSTDYQGYIKDPFISYLGEVTIADRYKPELEAALKKLVPFFKRSDINGMSNKTLDMNVTLQLNQKPTSESTTHQFFKPTLGVRMAEFSKEGAMVKPGFDILTYRNEQNTHLVISAGLAVNLKGQVYPDGEFTLTQGLPNASDSSHPTTYFESKTYVDSYSKEMLIKVGFRQEIGNHQSLGIYSRYLKSFEDTKQDFGVGFYFQKKF